MQNCNCCCWRRSNRIEMAKEYTRAEVGLHKTAESLWIIIGSSVYDVTKFLEEVSAKCINSCGWTQSRFAINNSKCLDNTQYCAQIDRPINRFRGVLIASWRGRGAAGEGWCRCHTRLYRRGPQFGCQVRMQFICVNVSINRFFLPGKLSRSTRLGILSSRSRDSSEYQTYLHQ